MARNKSAFCQAKRFTIKHENTMRWYCGIAGGREGVGCWWKSRLKFYLWRVYFREGEGGWGVGARQVLPVTSVSPGGGRGGGCWCPSSFNCYECISGRGEGVGCWCPSSFTCDECISGGGRGWGVGARQVLPVTSVLPGGGRGWGVGARQVLPVTSVSPYIALNSSNLLPSTIRAITWCKTDGNSGKSWKMEPKLSFERRW